MSAPRVDVGSGFNYRTLTETNAEGPTGAIVEGPAGEHCQYQYEGRCAGGINFENSTIGARQGRPLWKVVATDPLTLTPSIRCGCDLKHPGQGQHGFITGGRWVNAGGIIS